MNALASSPAARERLAAEGILLFREGAACRPVPVFSSFF